VLFDLLLQWEITKVYTMNVPSHLFRKCPYVASVRVWIRMSNNLKGTFTVCTGDSSAAVGYSVMILVSVDCGAEVINIKPSYSSDARN